MKGEHVHGPTCGHTLFRGRWCNTPYVKPGLTPVEIWLTGYFTALKSFERDIRKGGERSKRQNQSITWSGKP